MAFSREMRILESEWKQNRFWPKQLTWIEISGIRGWSGHRIRFDFPITVLVGENGSGKSTILQAAAASYKNTLPGPQILASDFFQDTSCDAAGDPVSNAETHAYIRVGLQEGESFLETSLRKLKKRWSGNKQRRERPVYYIDLRRIHALSARLSYQKEKSLHDFSNGFSGNMLSQLSRILGTNYTADKIATIETPACKQVLATQLGEHAYSEFHQGAGAITATEILANNFEKYSLVLIDEIESSLHPSAQRRLIRELAKIARQKEIQFIISTHSAFVLEEIVPEGRLFILDSDRGKTTVLGVSSELAMTCFAMTSFNDEQHPACDVFVEDSTAKILIRETITYIDRNLSKRIAITPFGKASVGSSLGILLSENRFSRPTVIFLDGGQRATEGVHVLPGDDAPEQVIFQALKNQNWPDVYKRIGRSSSETAEILESTMLLPDHHMWLTNAGDQLCISSTALWHAMCASWIRNCASESERLAIADPIKAALDRR